MLTVSDFFCGCGGLSQGFKEAGFDIKTGIDKDRPVMGMHGYGGQHIVIDFEKSRIVVTNALHENFNYAKIVYDPIKKGK